MDVRITRRPWLAEQVALVFDIALADDVWMRAGTLTFTEQEAAEFQSALLIGGGGHIGFHIRQETSWPRTA